MKRSVAGGLSLAAGSTANALWTRSAGAALMKCADRFAMVVAPLSGFARHRLRTRVRVKMTATVLGTFAADKTTPLDDDGRVGECKRRVGRPDGTSCERNSQCTNACVPHLVHRNCEQAGIEVHCDTEYVGKCGQRRGGGTTAIERSFSLCHINDGTGDCVEGRSCKQPLSSDPSIGYCVDD